MTTKRKPLGLLFLWSCHNMSFSIKISGREEMILIRTPKGQLQKESDTSKAYLFLRQEVCMCPLE